MRRLFLKTSILLSLLISTSAIAVAPGAAGALSIIPGLGQVVTGNTLEGLGWFATSIVLFTNQNARVRDVGFKFWEYNIYDAYRDAGAKDAAKNTALENYVSFLNPLNIVDPISVGVIGYGTLRARTASSTAHLGPDGRVTGAFFYGFVGWGEEGLFRGALFPGLSHVLGSYTLGAVTSSAIFSLSHLLNTQAYYHSGAGLTELFALGLVFCLQTKINHFDLRHSIFTHAWYDFVIDYASKGSTALERAPMLRVGILF